MSMLSKELQNKLKFTDQSKCSYNNMKGITNKICVLYIVTYILYTQ